MAIDVYTANVVVYARYSSAGQNDQSIDGQLEKCREYAAQRGMRIVAEYCDRALSGRYAETRPEFQRMISDSAKHGFEYILVWKLDRFSRDRYDSAIYKKKLRANGVRVLSVTEGIEESSESVLLEAILEAMAEEYSRQLAQNVRRGMRQNAEKCLTVGGQTPLGYDIVDKKYKINAAEAEVVRQIHAAYLDGMPQKRIVEMLDAQGMRNKRGNPVTLNQVKTILRSVKYAGVYAYGNEIRIDGGIPAIVSPEEKERVLAMLEANGKAPGHAKAKVEYYLHGKLFCGECGAPMVGECGRGKGGATYYYYTCSTRKKAHTCTKRAERKDVVELYICQQIVQQVLTDERIDMISDAVVAEYAKSFDASGIKPLEKELRELDKQLDALVDSLVKTTSAAAIDRINAKIETAETRRKAVSDELSHLKVASAAEVRKEDVKAWMMQYKHGDLTDEGYRSKLIELFLNSAYLYDDRLVLFFSFDKQDKVPYSAMLSVMGESSDLGSLALPDVALSEQIVIINGIFGIMIGR